MKLTYRGIPHTVETGEVNLSGQYRGAAFSFDTHSVVIPQAVATLHYRGVSYLRGR
jgi:Domain of unknown function (DUF4278)